MKRLPLLIVLTALMASTGAPTAFAKLIISTATGGDWNANSSWSLNRIPGGGDDVIILAGATISVSQNNSVNSITFSNNSTSAATLTINSGSTLSVGGSVTAENAAATNTTALIQGAGAMTCNTLTVGGTTSPTPAGSDFTSTLTTTISNLTISGNLSVDALYNPGPAAANQGTFALSSGVVSANGVTLVTVPFFGPILTLATGAQNGALVITGGAPFNIMGGGSSTFTPSGTNATVIYAAGGQTVYAATYQNLTLTNNGPKTITGVTVNGVLSMQGTATATVAPTYGPNATLQYAGSGPQSQSNGPELTLTIPNLSIANTNGVTLTNSPTVSNLLTLASGKLITGTNRLIVGANGSISGGSSNSYVAGNLQKNFSVGTQSFSYPVGNGEFAPLTLSNISVTAAGGVIASTTTNAPQQIGTSGINTNLEVDRFWTLTNSGGTFGSYNATFNYPADDVDVGVLAPEFVVAVLSNGTWSTATVSGTPTTNSTSISGQSGFGTFVIGDPTTMAWKMSITSINGGSSPQVGSPFNVIVQSQDSGGTTRNVAENTSFALNLQAGSGVLGGTLTGTISAGSNSVTISGVTYSVAQSGVKLGAAVTSGQALSNAVSAAFTVTPGNQTITFPSPGDQTYGVSPITLTATASSGLPVSYSVTSGPATVSSGVMTITGAGSVTVRATQSGNTNWNAATPVSQTISVAQKVVTGSFTAKNKAYDGTTTATVLTTNLSGVINSDAVNLTVGTAAFSDKNAGNGKTVIASGLGLSGAKAGNYTLASTFATNTANISAVTLTVTANNTNRTYGAANPAFTVSYSGFVSGENSSVLSGAPAVTTSATNGSTVAGSPYPITPAQGTLSDSNYTFSFANGNLTVTPATLTVTANNTNRAYGAVNPAFTVSYTGFMNGESNSVLSGVPSVTTTATTASSVAGSPYAITVTQGTLSAANYIFSCVNGSLSVTGATLTVTASNTNKIYGAANPAFSVSYSGFVNGENSSVLSGAPSVTTTATTGSGVVGNPYAITVAQGTLTASNYTFNFVSGNLTVTAVTLTVTANDTNRTYGAANPALTVTYGGFANGDTASVLSGAPLVTTSATTNSLVPGSPYPITATLGTLSNANYSFAFVNGNLTVTPATLTVTANSISRPYDTTNPELDVNYTGFVNGEDTNVLSGAPVVATTAGPGSPVPGSPYPITVSQGTLSATNYNFNFVNGNLTVMPVVLTVTAGDTNRTYGADNPAFTVSYSGFVSGDDPGVLSGAPLVTSSAGPGSPVAGGPYAVTASQGTLTATNYSFAFVNGSLTINPAMLTITANDQSRPFGTTNPVLTASYSGFVNGETTNVLSGSAALSTTATSSSPPGTYPIQIAAGTLSDNNYVFAFNDGTLTVISLPPILTIQRIAGPTNVVVLSTVGLIPNNSYQILSSTDLVNWSQIGTAQSAADGSLFFTNAIVSPAQFYRTLGP